MTDLYKRSEQMKNNNSTNKVCPFGEKTLLTSIKSGYANLTLGLVALFENGFQPGDVFSRKQLIDCGIEVDLAKTIMNQCEGRDYDKRKIAKDEENKLTSIKITENNKKIQVRATNSDHKNLSQEEKQTFNFDREAIEGIFGPDILPPSKNGKICDLIDRGTLPKGNQLSSQGKSELNNIIRILESNLTEMPQLEDTECRSKNLFLIKNETPTNQDIGIKPPQPSDVKALFSISNYSNQEKPLDISQYLENRGRGRTSRLYVIPSLQEYGKLFGVIGSDPVKYEVSGHRKTKSFCDAVHLEWMKKNENPLNNKHSLRNLSAIQGDSPKTIRERNKRTGITSERNVFSNPVTSLEVNGLLLRKPGGCWFELDCSGNIFSINSSLRLQLRPRRYPLSASGLILAMVEWQNSPTIVEFFDCLRICGYDVSTYHLPSPQNAIQRSDQVANEIAYEIAMEVSTE